MTVTTSFRRLGKTLAAFALLGAAVLLPAGNAAANDDLCSPFRCSIKSYYSDTWFGTLVGEYTRGEDGICRGWGTSGPWVVESGYLCATTEP